MGGEEGKKQKKGKNESEKKVECVRVRELFSCRSPKTTLIGGEKFVDL